MMLLAALVLFAPVKADTAASPRMARLIAEVAERGQAAAEDFWREIAAAGGPLVEPGAGPRERLVTFLWRATTPIRDVLILGAAGRRSPGGR